MSQSELAAHAAATVPGRLVSALLLTLGAPLSLAAEPAPAAPLQPSRSLGFDPGFLQLGSPEDQSNVDISGYAERNVVQPGLYRAEVWLNGRQVTVRDLQFVAAADSQSDATPCLSRALLQQWGIDLQHAVAATPDQADCVDLPALIPQASVNFDLLQQRLEIGVPQVWMSRPPRGANMAQWDNGTSAGLLEYSVNAASGRAAGVRSDTAYASARAGLNLGAWRLRSTLNAQSSRGQANTVQALDNYAQRDIAPVQARLTLGQAVTPADLFDGVAFSGLQLASDDAMLPDEQQGYVPVVRGVAQTNARISIRQRGFEIYSGLVAPGPFAIDNLPNATTGDLEVTIAEADGRETRFVTPFASLPALVREGGFRYSATFGRYRDGARQHGSWFGQATATRGMQFDLTVYGGLLGAYEYQAAIFGLGKNLGELGALSFDLAQSSTLANWSASGAALSGQSVRMLYGKVFGNGLNLRVLGTRYSSSGYRSFAEAMLEQRTGKPHEHMQDLARLGARKIQLQGNLSQSLGRMGALYAAVTQQSYHAGPRALSAQLGYSTAVGPYALGVYYTEGRNGGGGATRQVSANLSIPFGAPARSSLGTATLNSSVLHDSVSGISEQLGINGTALAERTLSYALNAHHGAGAGRGDGTLSFAGRYATVGGGISAGAAYQQLGLSLSGSVAVHGGGITLGHALGDTAALIDTHGAPDVAVASFPGVRTDGHGYAIVPNLAAYRANRIELDPSSARRNDSVEMQDTISSVVPTRGALVRVSFASRIGQKALLTLTDGLGKALPFGAQIYDVSGHEAGVVGERGEAYVSGLAAMGVLNVRWGSRNRIQCMAKYQLDAATVRTGPLPTLAVHCLPQAER